MDSERGGWMELKALALLVQLELLLLDRFRFCFCFFWLDSSVVLLDADGVMGAAASPFCGGSFALRVLFLCLAMMTVLDIDRPCCLQCIRIASHKFMILVQKMNG